mmetsp:Transcript_33863/g.74014  ORF Transcript_33863/g.74014 Transcript_33863/m.74014 type:complete len:336 (+) Transcript_33863:111-1118(+)
MPRNTAKTTQRRRTQTPRYGRRPQGPWRQTAAPPVAEEPGKRKLNQRKPKSNRREETPGRGSDTKRKCMRGGGVVVAPCGGHYHSPNLRTENKRSTAAPSLAEGLLHRQGLFLSLYCCQCNARAVLRPHGSSCPSCILIWRCRGRSRNLGGNGLAQSHRESRSRGRWRLRRTSGRHRTPRTWPRNCNCATRSRSWPSNTLLSATGASNLRQRAACRGPSQRSQRSLEKSNQFRTLAFLVLSCTEHITPQRGNQCRQILDLSSNGHHVRTQLVLLRFYPFYSRNYGSRTSVQLAVPRGRLHIRCSGSSATANTSPRGTGCHERCWDRGRCGWLHHG